MAAPPTFRSRLDTMWFLIAGLVLVALTVTFYSPLSLQVPGIWPRVPRVWVRTGAAGGFCLASLVLYLLSSRRVTVHDDFLEMCELFITQRWLWVSIRAVKRPHRRLLRWPGIVLRVGRRRRWVMIPASCERFEQLVREILARVPPEAVEEGLRRELDRPPGPVWRDRVIPMAMLGAFLLSLAWGWHALHRDLLDGGDILFFALLPAVGCVGTAGGLAREWRGTPGLLWLGTPLLVSALLALTGPGCVLGVWFGFKVLMACCVAWAVGSLAFCLPWRRTWRRVSALYGACLIGFVALACRPIVPSPVPFVRSPRVAMRHGGIGWSADGRTLCWEGTPTDAGPGRTGDWRIVDSMTLELLPTPRLPRRWAYGRSGVPRFAYHTPLLDRRHALFVEMRFDESLDDWISELHVLDTVGGASRCVASCKGRLRFGRRGPIAWRQEEAVFVARQRNGATAHRLDLRDLTVQEVSVDFDARDLVRVCYRSDGALLLRCEFTDWANCPTPRPSGIWVLERGQTRPQPLHVNADGDAWSAVSPDGQRAVIDGWPGMPPWASFGVLDLLTGQIDPVRVWGSGPDSFGDLWWLGDSSAFVYITWRRGRDHLVVVDPVTGRTVRRHTLPWSKVDAADVSSDGRYVVQESRTPAANLHVADLLTGRVVRLPFATGLASCRQPRWSPTEPRVAVVLHDGAFPHATARLYVFDANGM